MSIQFLAVAAQIISPPKTAWKLRTSELSESAVDERDDVEHPRLHRKRRFGLASRLKVHQDKSDSWFFDNFTIRPESTIFPPKWWKSIFADAKLVVTLVHAVVAHNWVSIFSDAVAARIACRNVGNRSQTPSHHNWWPSQFRRRQFRIASQFQE